MREGLTTVEKLRSRYPVGNNPFNRGCWQNFLDACFSTVPESRLHNLNEDVPSSEVYRFLEEKQNATTHRIEREKQLRKRGVLREGLVQPPDGLVQPPEGLVQPSEKPGQSSLGQPPEGFQVGQPAEGLRVGQPAEGLGQPFKLPLNQEENII